MVVAITGASSGIGKATAELLVAEGAIVILGARRNERLVAIVEEIEKHGGKAACLEIDVTRNDDLVKLTSLAIERFGKLDVSIHFPSVNRKKTTSVPFL